jgi:hypothetical protein
VKTYSLAYLEDDAAVSITAHGIRGRDNNDDMVLDALAEAARRGCRKFLVDDRLVDLRLTFMDIYQRPQRLKELGLKADMRVAIAFAATSPRAADYRFFENVCFNNGLPLMRVFSDYDQAQAWLRQG